MSQIVDAVNKSAKSEFEELEELSDLFYATSHDYVPHRRISLRGRQELSRNATIRNTAKGNI